jgi:hypothetical protein
MAAEHRIETRCFRGRQGATPTFSATVDHAARCGLQQREHYNTYSGMALRRAALPGEEQRGRRMDGAATRVLWCELDVKHFGGDSATPLRRLRAFGLPLSIIVFTGGGFQVQVLLSDLIDLSLSEMKDRVEAVNRHLAHAIAGQVPVDNVGDLPRILRVPGTSNFKYRPPRPVTLVRLEPHRRYTLDEVEGYLRRHYPLPQPAPQPQRHSDATRTPVRALTARRWRPQQERAAAHLRRCGHEASSEAAP